MPINRMEDQVYLCGTGTVRFFASDNGRLRSPETIHICKCLKKPSFPCVLVLMDLGGALFCVSWGTVRKCHSIRRAWEKAWAGLFTSWGTSSVPLTRTSLPIHVCMGFAREDTVLVGDCIQRLGDVQEGVAAVNNPCHFLCTGSKFVVYQLRE